MHRITKSGKVPMVNIKNRLSYVYTFILLILLWQITSVLTLVPFIPTPLAVFTNMYEIFSSKLINHMLYSVSRIFAAAFLSTLIGTAIGLCIGYFKTLDKIFAPAIYLVYPIPKIALLPVIMLIFGLGETPKIIMISLVILFQILVSARDAVKSIPPETYHVLYSLGARRIDIFRRIILPASLPNLLTSLRISLGTALSVLFFTETFGTEHGLGFFIMDAWIRVDYIEMYSGIVTLSITGLGLFLILDSIEKLICKWK